MCHPTQTPFGAAYPTGFPQLLSTIPGHTAPLPFKIEPSGLGPARVNWSPIAPTYPAPGGMLSQLSGLPSQPGWDPMANLGPLPSNPNFGLYSSNNSGMMSSNNIPGPLPSTNNLGPLPSPNLGQLPSANLGLRGQSRFGPPNMNGGSRNQGLSQAYPNFGLPNNNSSTNNNVGYGSSAAGTSLAGNMARIQKPFPNPYAVPGQNRFLPTVPPVPSSPYVRSNKFNPNNPYAALLRAQAGAGPLPGAAANSNGTMPYGQMGSTLGNTTGTTSLAQLPNLPPTPAPAITGAAAVAPTRLLAAGPPTAANNNLTSTNNPTVQYRQAVSSALNNNPIVQQSPIVPGLPTVSSSLGNNYIDPQLLAGSASFNNSNNNNSVVSGLPPVSSSLTTPSATATGTQYASSSSIGPASSSFTADPESTFPNPDINLACASSTFPSEDPFSSAVKSKHQDEKLFEFVSLPELELFSQHSTSVLPPAASEQPAIPTASEQVPTNPLLQDDNMGMPIRTYPRPADEAEASSSNSRANVSANSNPGGNMNIDNTGHSAANNNSADDPHSEVYDLLRELRVAAHSEGLPNQAARFEDITANGHPAQNDPAADFAMIDALSTIAHIDLTSDLDSDATELVPVVAQRDNNSTTDSGNSESDKENSAAGSDETGEQANGYEGSGESSSSDSEDDEDGPIPHQPRVPAARMRDPAVNPIAAYWDPQPAPSRRALPLSSAGVAFETDGFMPFAPWRVRDLVPFREETTSRVITAPARYLVTLGQLYPDAVFAVARHPASANYTTRIVGRALPTTMALHFPGSVNNVPREGEDLGALYIVQLVQRDWPMGGVALLPDTAHARQFVEQMQGAFDLLPAGREAFYFLPVMAPVGGAGRARARGMLVCRAYEGVQGPQEDRLVVDWMLMNRGTVDQYERGREVLVFMGEAAVEADRWPRRRIRAVSGPGGGRADAARQWPAEEE